MSLPFASYSSGLVLHRVAVTLNTRADFLLPALSQWPHRRSERFSSLPKEKDQFGH